MNNDNFNIKYSILIENIPIITETINKYYYMVYKYTYDIQKAKNN